MPYITMPRENKPYQLTFDDIMFGFDESKLLLHKNTRDTVTWHKKAVNDKLIAKTDFQAMYIALTDFCIKYADIISVKDKSTLYRSFKIAKRAGGLRQIDAPCKELKLAQKELKHILETRFYASYHTTAFAYVRGRCAVNSMQRHQKNNSRWFLKLDFSKFFPSTTPEFLVDMLCETYPICEFVKHDFGYKELFEKALSICFLRGGLPQGAPTSPMLTNMMMIPIDHSLSKMCREHHPHLFYTRYADDILISSEFDFKWSLVQFKISKILNEFKAPFTLNAEKTRYGSSAGRNWNLGVMLNKDNQITIGHEKKKVFRAMIYQFMIDYLKGNAWPIEDVQHFLGLASYYRMVEKDNINSIFEFYNKKFNRNVEQIAKELLKPQASLRPSA